MTAADLLDLAFMAGPGVLVVGFICLVDWWCRR